MSDDRINKRRTYTAELNALDEMLRQCEENMKKSPAELEQLQRLLADLLKEKKIRHVA